MSVCLRPLPSTGITASGRQALESRRGPGPWRRRGWDRWADGKEAGGQSVQKQQNFSPSLSSQCNCVYTSIFCNPAFDLVKRKAQVGSEIAGSTEVVGCEKTR